MTMRLAVAAVVVVAVAMVADRSHAYGDSLRNAINAMDRKQRDLAIRPAYYDLYTEGGRNGLQGSDVTALAFLDKQDDYEPRYSPPYGKEIEAYMNYLDTVNQFPTAFRERLEQNRENQKQFYDNYPFGHPETINPDYKQDAMEDYQEFSDGNYYEDMKKKGYIYVKKRSDGLSEDLLDDPEYDYEKKYSNSPRLFPYSLLKRFPISKRSSDSGSQEITEKTDPKVEKDLSQIFHPLPTTNKPDTTKNPALPDNQPEPIKEKPKITTTKRTTKELTAGETPPEQFQVKKKSIDWRSYFGYDRRKKSGDTMDKEWLLQRFHKAMAVTDKRATEYPPQHFEKKPDKLPYQAEEQRVQQVDGRLRDIEEAVLGDTLKYVGAHEGVADPQELQEAKDVVISRLAAAYNLEKMRRALGEYKLSIAKERSKLKEQQNMGDDFVFAPEKRVSVPRKQAVDEDASKADEVDDRDNLRCIHGGGRCKEQSYRVANDVLERYDWRPDECPKVGLACNEFAESVGKFKLQMETSCNIHQLCMLCDDNNWYPPTRKCNSLFLAKSTVLCQGNEDCKKTIQRELPELLLLGNSLKNDSSDECNLMCPDDKR